MQAAENRHAFPNTDRLPPLPLGEGGVRVTVTMQVWDSGYFWAKPTKFEYNHFMSDDEILFTASTPLGFQVRVTRAYWEIIVTVKHPVMEGREEDVKRRWKTLTKSVRASQMKAYICFIGKNVKSDGFAQFRNEQAMKAF